ncbi:hypothetical protein AYR62_04575 [Secundilactobacillus paracollinoides]|uniref:Inosine-5-monophosphate dehydrogenase n=2 Tax=Secundilactobacillus paracollinoides TaxID=240427 RepID=A0A1B2J0C3_9LACO|nr:DUF1002 domain-containing protein [Secundilactobacillus paracollinoides]ANZ61790.1 hypothetical protein AYR61_10855 [Secundilactobacillus paracollinoides]ANZ63427.1 hypothetical protein AYR62_04575 [Secundilactobacillus paracollinoides]ANZ67709.1 hypothetical protein AYR63_11610 [Secundilactobacillus paracollinoides]KRL75811.1 hypothetical protein FC17_GL002545 [Secundilactobacillus paracollinoides DSM 15502 = JCM 11969]
MKITIRLGLLAAVLLLTLGTGSALSHADTTTGTTSSATAGSSDSADSSSAVQTKALSKSYVVYGSGLASEDKDAVAKALGVQSNYEALTVTGSDYATYINSAGTTDASMISSVSLAPADPGSGVKVNIADFDGKDNITEVTSQQYAMVATMAGVKDVIITVTADKAVSGESALTGVYKALAADGISLNSENTSAANSVLDATQPAIDSNSNNKSYPGKLMSAVGDVSSKLAKQRQNNNEYATKADIQQMLNEALASRGIKSSTSTTVINNLVIALAKVQKAPVSSTSSYVSNVKSMASSLSSSVGNKMAELKDFASRADTSGIMGFLSRIWQAIVNFFSNLF